MTVSRLSPPPPPPHQKPKPPPPPPREKPPEERLVAPPTVAERLRARHQQDGFDPPGRASPLQAKAEARASAEHQEFNDREVRRRWEQLREDTRDLVDKVGEAH